MNLETKLKTVKFWLSLGALNHLVAIVVLGIGCIYSSFTCQGDAMKSVLTTYAFTLFTPQLALEAIIVLAIFLVAGSFREFRDNARSTVLFLASLALLVGYTILF